MRSPRALIPAAAVLLAVLVAGILAVSSGGGVGSGARPAGARPAIGLRGHPQAVEPDVGVPVIAEAPDQAVDQPASSPARVPRDPEARLATAPAGAAISPGAPTDAEVRAELRQLEGNGHGQAQVLADGEAVAPAGAPLLIKQVIAAGNAIARMPYLWGGGHARLYDTGYDCSGSLSFTFIQAGLLDHPIAQGWSTIGEPGPGRWISIYSNSGHVFMIVAGLRFDTSAIHIAGSRWTAEPRSTAGFTVRHVPGL